ncbi:MAG: chloride channel protein [Candidatus [Bacteroides] periocalifornicus]|uniref:Chloride channel protein n=1 Tax=Candidatus [Bacteroides] periocalifornicus TaxID=1702214 RepID=A0A0Q4B7H7_9BACT|nr:MAG: chloride channel protein [Candidatus [Bacteroides] periocalifornicus]
MRWLNRRVHRVFLSFLGLGTRRHVIFVSLVVGVVCALAAMLLKFLAHWTAGMVNDLISHGRDSLVLLVLPAIGIVLTLLFVRYAVGENIAHGVSNVLLAISQNRGRIQLHNTWSSIVASSITIGFGGSVGAEAPIVMTGAAIGSNLGRFFRMDSKSVILMVGCGASAGIAAIFKAPLAGLVFTLEVLMLDLTMSSLVPLLVSSVTATITTSLLMGGGSLFHFVYNVPFDLSKTPYYLILGVFTGLVSVYFTRTAIALGGWFGRMSNTYRRVLAGVLLLGGLIYLYPPLYGEGYSSVQQLFEGKVDQLFSHSPLAFVTGNPWLLLVALGALFLLKVVAMAATTGAGGVGGSFAPTLFVGAVAGFFMARLLNMTMDAGVGVSNFVLVGMAGAMAGVMHAPLLGIFLIAELTEGYVLLIPLMLTATVAYITVSSFDRHSIYTMRLAAQGLLITHHKDQAVLTMLQVKNVIETDLAVVHPQQTLRELVRVVAHSRRNIFPVVDDAGALQGIVLLDDIREIMFETEKYDSLTVGDLMVRPPGVIQADEPMNVVMRKFEETGAWNLPVVEGGRYIGFVSKAKIFSAYREQLVQFSNE